MKWVVPFIDRIIKNSSPFYKEKNEFSDFQKELFETIEQKNNELINIVLE